MQKICIVQITIILGFISFSHAVGDEDRRWTHKNFCAGIDSFGHLLTKEEGQKQDPKARFRDSDQTLYDLYSMRTSDDYKGKGSFGKVYKVKAVDKSIPGGEKDYALKFMANSSHNRREINIMLYLKDLERIPKIYECEISPNSIFIRQTLLDKTLHDTESVEAVRSMSLDERARLFVGALEVLKKIHSKKFVHGDIKPENMMFENDKREAIYFIDFGLSMPINSQVFAGTPIFMSPELILGGGYHEIDENEDVWAFIMSIIDLEIGHVINLHSKYGKCLRQVLNTYSSFRAREMEKCLSTLDTDIKAAFEEKKSDIGRGCSDLTLDIYRNILLTGIAKPRSGRLSVDELIEGLMIVSTECEENLTSLSANQSFDGIVNSPLVNEYNAGLTDSKFRLIPVIEPNRFEKFIHNIAGQISDFINFFSQPRQTIRPLEIDLQDEPFAYNNPDESEPSMNPIIHTPAYEKQVTKKKEPITLAEYIDEQEQAKIIAEQSALKQSKTKKKIFENNGERHLKMKEMIDRLMEEARAQAILSKNHPSQITSPAFNQVNVDFKGKGFTSPSKPIGQLKKPMDAYSDPKKRENDQESKTNGAENQFKQPAIENIRRGLTNGMLGGGKGGYLI